MLTFMIPGITKSGILDVPRASSCEKRSPNSERTNEPTLSLVFPQCSTQAAAAPKAGKSHKPRMMCRTLIEMEAKHEKGTTRFS